MTSPPVPPLVLLVEDDRDTREMYALYLDFCDLTVVAVDSVDAALARTIERLPDIVITDYRLGGSANGADLCRRLREDERTAGIPVIVMTGSARTLDEEIATAPGSIELRVKPYLPDAMVADIRRILERHPHQRLAG
jgi:two-component system, cell cycle response regulator DivK